MRPRRLQRGRGRAQARPQAPRQGSASSVAVDSAKRTATLENSKTHFMVGVRILGLATLFTQALFPALRECRNPPPAKPGGRVL